ncbi:MAG: MATE family efflux transporter [Treponemataceae bacterium]
MRDLTVGKPSKVLLRFCLPLFLSVIFQQLYNLADSVVAGQFIGENALAAVGNSYEITLIYLAFAFGCNIGGSVLTAQFFGAKNYEKMKSSISTVFITTAITCLGLMLFGFVFGKTLLKAIQTPDNIMQDSLDYLNIYTLSLPFVFFYNLANGLFAAFGDSTTPFIFLAVSSLSNIAMDILFVAVFNMGVPGVAWATLICQGFSAVASILVLLKRLKKIQTTGKIQYFSWQIFKSFTEIAIPSVLQQSFISVGNIFIQGIINSFGSTATAGYSAAIKLQNMVISGFTTIGNGISSYSAQNYGAEKHERIITGHKAALKLVWLIAIPLTLLYFFAGNFVLRLFLLDEAVEAKKVGLQFLKIVAPFYIIVSTKLSTDGVLRGLGLMRPFMIATFTDLILRVLFGFVFSASFGLIGVWYAWPIGWLIGTIMSYIFYRIYVYNKIKSATI